MVAARPEPSFDTRRPFTRGDAVRAGVDPKILRTSRFRRIFRGVYVEAAVAESPWVRPAAAVALHPPGAYASHTSAARLHGLPVPSGPFEHVTVLAERDRRPRPGLRSHVTTRPPRLVRARGVPASHPFQMYVELASVLSLVDLVVVGDALVRVGKIPPRRLVRACEESTDQHAAAALRAARYVRADVDSPMETRLRMLIVLAGLPEPKVNHVLRDDFGNVLRRFDLCYPELKLIVEYDGRHHIEREESWEGDLDRREELDEGEWRIVVVTAKGVFRQPERTIARLHRALQSRGARDLPSRLKDDWRVHFPGRS